MQGLTESDICALLSKPKRSKQVTSRGKGTVYVTNTNEDGTSTFGSEVIRKMGDYDIGAFQGRAGTIHRSRKGKTRRGLDGRRFYVKDSSLTQVIAYKLV